MIWVGGEIVADDALKISVLDRTFEHGLGLFETLRTWNGRSVLLNRHLVRMKISARILGLPLLENHLPDARAVQTLADANGLEDGHFRITCSGGDPGVCDSVVWMTAQPLAAPFPEQGISLMTMSVPSASWNPLHGHKTLNYWPNRLAHKFVNRFKDPREALFVDTKGNVREGSRTNLFAVRNGRLVTPRADGQSGQPLLLRGIMREVVIERAAYCDLTVRIETVSLNSLKTVDEIFMTNSVRGMVPVRKLDDCEFDSPGPVTVKIRDEVLGWLNRGGIDA